MSSTASPVPGLRQGVAPLRAGEGYSFLLRRLHSLSGIVPVGAFLAEHVISNAFATRGPEAYTKQVAFLSSFPFVVGLELFGIWLPILFHAVYGFYIWYRGDGNTITYPWSGNWMYTAQRWTGGIAFAYILFHTWEMRFTGVHLLDHPDMAFGKVQASFQSGAVIAFYIVGMLAASWHFAYGLWLFAAKWGITTGDQARRRFSFVCLVIGLGFAVVGLSSIYSFLYYPHQPLGAAASAATAALR